MPKYFLLHHVNPYNTRLEYFNSNDYSNYEAKRFLLFFCIV